MKATFAGFFEAVWGFEPFPWQARLAERVRVEGWPDVLDLPTGAGKTAALDVALFHLVADGGRTAPRRVVLVVDRRVVVDQVGARARRLLTALTRPEHPATREVAEVLRSMVGPGVPLLQPAVYGAALGETWKCLKRIALKGPLDLGIEALQPHLDALPDGGEALRVPAPEAPVLLPAYLDQWAQTQPRPYADPDVLLFLHGIPSDSREALPDVQVVWRADVTTADLDSASVDPDARERLVDLVAAAPPGSLEAMALPIWTFRRWLAGEGGLSPDDDVADVEGQRAPADDGVSEGRRVLVWRGRRDSAVIASPDVRPGWLVVVPASYGGIGPHGTFAPDATRGGEQILVVDDLGDAVQLIQRGRPTLRLDPRVHPRSIGGRFASLLPDLRDEDVDVRAALREALAAAREDVGDEAPDWLVGTLDALRNRHRFVRVDGVDAGPHGARWVALGRALDALAVRQALGEDVVVEPPSDATTDEDDGSFTGARAGLDAHLEGVAELAEEFGRRCGLPEGVVRSLRYAGRIHDVGKVDRRFQLWLHGGDEVAMSRSPVLAKSATRRQDAAARRMARARAGYPSLQRHELVTLEMAERSAALRARVEADGGDWDLVLHLVASHHGWCRPLAPAFALAEEDSEPVEWAVEGIPLTGSTAHGLARVESGVAARFWRLTRRYGWHELAWIEAVLRLADHRRSAREQGSGQ